jgi:hypothetical protein
LITQSRHAERGQALVEFALCLPIVLLLVGGAAWLIRVDVTNSRISALAHTQSRALAMPEPIPLEAETVARLTNLPVDRVVIEIPRRGDDNEAAIMDAIAAIGDGDAETIQDFLEGRRGPAVRLSVVLDTPRSLRDVYNRQVTLQAVRPVPVMTWDEQVVRGGLLESFERLRARMMQEDPRLIVEKGLVVPVEERPRRRRHGPPWRRGGDD